MNYWEECIASSLEEAGIIATPEQIKQIARDVQISHENYGTAHGYDCIPNPMAETLERERRKHKQEIEQEEKRVEILKKNIASRYKSDVYVSIINGYVEIEPQR